MNCTNCGKVLIGEAKFCDACGSPVVAKQVDTQPATQTTPVTQTTPANSEAQENKTIFILTYLGILFFLPLVSCPNSKVGRFHANQGLLFLITAVAGQIVLNILSSIILAISWRLWAITSLLFWGWSIALLALMIIGMINANKGVQKPLPFIGNFTIIK